MKKVSAIVILGILAAGFLAFWILPDRDRSQMENRSLAQAPAVSARGYLDSSLRQDWEDYVADQFPLRDDLLVLYRRLTARGGVLPGARFRQVIEGNDGYDFYVFDENQILKVWRGDKPEAEAAAWAEALDGAAAVCREQGIDLLLYLAPSKTEALQDLLPTGAVSDPDRALWERIRSRMTEDLAVADAMAEFEKIPLAQKEELFYHTDHHWNHRGSYLGFEILCGALERRMGLSADVRGMDFIEYPLNQTSFVGSYNQNLGAIFSSEEELAYENPRDLSRYDALTVEDREGRLAWDDFYATSTEGSYVSYATMYMPDLPYLHIHNDAAPNDVTLCVVKDSYFNAILPQTALLVSDLYVADPRYDEDFVLADFLEESGADGLLLFYSSTALIKSEEMLQFDMR